MQDSRNVFNTKEVSVIIAEVVCRVVTTLRYMRKSKFLSVKVWNILKEELRVHGKS